MYQEHDYIDYEFDRQQAARLAPQDRAAMLIQREKELAVDPRYNQRQKAALYAIAADYYGLPMADFANPFEREIQATSDDQTDESHAEAQIEAFQQQAQVDGWTKIIGFMTITFFFLGAAGVLWMILRALKHW